MKVPNAILKFSVRALFRAEYKNQICILTNKMSIRIMPVIKVLVLLGCASFCEVLKSLIGQFFLFFAFCLYVYFSIIQDYIKLRERSWRGALGDHARPRVKVAFMTGAFYQVEVGPIAYCTGEVGTFLLKCPPLTILQMNENIRYDLIAFDFKLLHFTYTYVGCIAYKMSAFQVPMGKRDAFQYDGAIALS
jgi:hypothetical protein